MPGQILPVTDVLLAWWLEFILFVLE